MKKLFILCMFLLLINLSSCTAVKINRFYEFVSSEAMDIEISRNTDSSINDVRLKYNKDLMIAYIEDGEVALDFVNNTVYVNYSGVKAYSEYDLTEFKMNDNPTDTSKYVSKIKSKKDILSFVLDLSQMNYGEETERVYCEVSFKEKRVSNIDIMSSDKEELKYQIKVNSYGDSVEGLQLPSKESYSSNFIYDIVIAVLMNKLKEVL